MSNPISMYKKVMKPVWDARKTYRKLQRHLDEQPVGFPSTLSGVELRLLQELFTTTEADIALSLTSRFENVKTIHSRARSRGYSEEALSQHLEEMEKKGCIALKTRNGEPHYSLHPFVVGMYEARLKELNPGFYLDTYDYFNKKFTFEYLMTDVPQMRVVPVDRAIEAKQNVATYDQIRAFVEKAGDRICIQDCICKKAKDMISDPCRTTDRREVCMTFADVADTTHRHGVGRRITQEEALEILAQSEKDGLVLMTSTTQEPEFVCACCRCCCGPVSMMRMMPRPVDFAGGNFQARANAATCNGCQKCLKRCPTRAIRFDAEQKRATEVDAQRCIGCGLCVATCKTESLQLVKKSKEFVPPKDHEELFEVIGRNKKSPVKKAVTIVKAMMGKPI